MDQDAQMKIRLPRKLKDQLEAAIVESKRSLNGEVVARLETSFQPRNSRDAHALTSNMQADSPHGMADLHKAVVALIGTMAAMQDEIDQLSVQVRELGTNTFGGNDGARSKSGKK